MIGSDYARLLSLKFIEGMHFSGLGSAFKELEGRSYALGSGTVGSQFLLAWLAYWFTVDEEPSVFCLNPSSLIYSDL